MDTLVSHGLSKEKREKQNHFCLFPLSSNTTVGLEVQADSQILSFISLLPSDADLFMQVPFEAAAHHL